MENPVKNFKQHMSFTKSKFVKTLPFEEKNRDSNKHLRTSYFLVFTLLKIF